MVKYIDSRLRNEIAEKLKKIESHPSVYEIKKNFIIKDLKTIGDIYSYWIENPELRRAHLLDHKSPETVKKQAMKGIQSVHNAWNYLNNPKLIEDFIHKIAENDFKILKSANALIMGDPANKGVGFRKYRVTLNCEEYYPPEGEDKIREKLKETNDEIIQLYYEDVIEAAISWHFEGAIIQPFEDGNKRTFRLIQDKILVEKGIPPVLISAGEAKYYHKLLCRAADSHGSQNIEPRKDFHNYCASKLNNGLDEILGDLEIPVIFKRN